MKNKIITIIFGLILILLTAMSLYSLIELRELKEEVLELSQGNVTGELSDELDITTTSYFEYYEATDSNYENMIKDVDTYILYFVGNNKASRQISSLMDIYIQTGYTVYSPVIFATKDNAPSIYKMYDINEEPALFYKNTDSEVSASGYQECYDLINEIVVTANSLIEEQE